MVSSVGRQWSDLNYKVIETAILSRGKSYSLRSGLEFWLVAGEVATEEDRNMPGFKYH